MAQVHLGRAVDGRIVVVKRVAPELEAQERLSELLTAEAQLTEMLSHPNIVRAVGFGRGRRDGAPYFALEWVSGLDLRALLKVCTKRKIALPIKFALSIVASVLGGLDEAHRARDQRGDGLGVVHRDVSPSNVLLGFDGSVKLCDFGIALASVMPAVPPDTIEGKAGYMSPEHAAAGSVDARADVYACGIMLWELLNGRRLYKPGKIKNLKAVAARRDGPPVMCRGLPHEEKLHAIVQRALRRDSAARFQSAHEMMRAIETYQADAQMAATCDDLAGWLGASLPDIAAAQRELAERIMTSPEVAADELDADSEVVASHARRIASRAIPLETPKRSKTKRARTKKRRKRGRRSPHAKSTKIEARQTPTQRARTLRELVATVALSCGATLALLHALASLGIL